MKLFALVLAASALVACSDRTPPAGAPASNEARAADAAAPSASDPPGNPSPAAPAPPAMPPTTPAPGREADYLGRWTGVEGMYLLVAPKPGGGVTLQMQWDLDHKGTFDGSVTAEGLRFVREGVAEAAVRTDGNATGLKYLAGKQDCLTVKAGEGYCRD